MEARGRYTMPSTGRKLLSVGIDVGTTTTQIAFSSLLVQESARPGHAPRLQVNAKDLLHQSPIFLTPLLASQEVDIAALTAIVRKEYQCAGLSPAQIETGAVIVTGEIARTSNADAILTALAHLAGDFVVTVAGPNVEAHIAGRGAGVAAYSASHYVQATSVDIGGGTANAAIFRSGAMLSSAALAVGGRLLVIDRISGIVQNITPPGRIIVEALDLPLREGEHIDLTTAEHFCTCMADLVADLIAGEVSELGQRLQLTSPLQGAMQSLIVFFSGGVGAYFYDPIEIHCLADVLVHDDLGPLFAQSLRFQPRIRKHHIQRPAETQRATVMGASSQTITLSGSTIWLGANRLPLRNLLVVRPWLTVEELTRPDCLADALLSAARRWDAEDDRAMLALALDLPARLNHTSLRAVAEAVVQYVDARSDRAQPAPVILVVERDYALALGQSISGLQPTLPLIVLDQIAVDEGDLIDIGPPLPGGRATPVAVKTLVFYH